MSTHLQKYIDAYDRKATAAREPGNELAKAMFDLEQRFFYKKMNLALHKEFPGVDVRLGQWSNGAFAVDFLYYPESKTYSILAGSVLRSQVEDDGAIFVIDYGPDERVFESSETWRDIMQVNADFPAFAAFLRASGGAS